MQCQVTRLFGSTRVFPFFVGRGWRGQWVLARVRGVPIIYSRMVRGMEQNKLWAVIGADRAFTLLFLTRSKRVIYIYTCTYIHIYTYIGAAATIAASKCCLHNHPKDIKNNETFNQYTLLVRSYAHLFINEMNKTHIWTCIIIKITMHESNTYITAVIHISTYVTILKDVEQHKTTEHTVVDFELIIKKHT